MPAAVRLLPRTAHHAGIEADIGTLRDTLERIGTPVRHAWRAAALRHALLLALSVGLILALVDARLGWSYWCAPAIATAIASILTAAAWRQAPGLDAIARFLDHALGLKEQLATALEVETTAPSSSSSVLGPRLQRQATDVAGRASIAWLPRGVRAGREWAAVAVLCGGLAGAVTLTFNGTQVAREATAPARVTAPRVSAPPVADSSSLAVRVAVVSAQNGEGARPARSATAARHGTTQRRPAGAQPPQTTGEIRRRNTGAPQASGSTGGAPANRGPQAPVLRHSESALPSGAPTTGKKGALVSSTSPNGGRIPTGAIGRSAGTASGRAGTGATKRAAQGGPSASRQGASTGGKPGGTANGGKSAQSGCLYGCAHLLPSQITAPGLITGKGQFTGKGLPGGQTAGHAAGAAPTLGTPNAQAPKSARQLTITSAYGRSDSARLSTKQVQGHNGPGGTQASSAARAGTTDGHTFDYVQPDANVRLPGDDAILGRYFTSSPASPAS